MVRDKCRADCSYDEGISRKTNTGRNYDESGRKSSYKLWYTTTVAPTLLTSRLSVKREIQLEICASWGFMGWLRLVGSSKS